MSTTDPAAVATALEQLLREEWGRLLALLLGRFRRLDLVEDALADAFEAASRSWAEDIPSNPVGWLHTTARRRILDRIRAETMARRKEPLLVVEAAAAEQRRASVAEQVAEEDLDEVLQMALMCTHPALDPAAASALTLRLVLGVPTADVARLFLVSESTMAARLTRAKKKIVAAGIPFAMPDSADLPDRLDVLAQTAYLAFTAGYAPSSGASVVRTELAGEAIRLVRSLIMRRPGEPVLVALLALMLLQHSRRDARVGPDGEIVLLPDQDRDRWHRTEVDEACVLLDSEVLRGPITRQAASYTVQARIAAVHAQAPGPEAVDWAEIVHWYDLLLDLSPTPGARLARAVAVAEQDGPDAGLAALDGLEVPGHRLAAVRAELLARTGRTGEAVEEFDRAIAACANTTESTHLRDRRDRIRADHPSASETSLLTDTQPFSSRS